MSGQSRAAEIEASLRSGQVPLSIRDRLDATRSGRLPWIATLSPVELLSVRSHGIRPIAAIAATCWLHYGWSWTEGHTQGWNMALDRLKAEARAAGANVVLDVKMRTIPLAVENSMDFTLVGTAASVEGMLPSGDPVVATVSALEFVKMLDADIVPTGIAVGAKYEWLDDYAGRTDQAWCGNVETVVLSRFWERIRKHAQTELRRNAAVQGNGVLAHVNFGQLFEIETDKIKRYLGRQIIVGTTVEVPKHARPRSMHPVATGTAFPHAISMVVDLHAGRSPLAEAATHHQSYGSNETEGAI